MHGQPHIGFTKIKAGKHRYYMSESSPRFDSRKAVREFTILDRYLQLETQWRVTHQLQALNLVPIMGIIQWHAAICLAEVYRSTRLQRSCG